MVIAMAALGREPGRRMSDCQMWTPLVFLLIELCPECYNRLYTSFMLGKVVG